MTVLEILKNMFIFIIIISLNGCATVEEKDFNKVSKQNTVTSPDTIAPPVLDATQTEKMMKEAELSRLEESIFLEIKNEINLSSLLSSIEKYLNSFSNGKHIAEVNELHKNILEQIIKKTARASDKIVNLINETIAIGFISILTSEIGQQLTPGISLNDHYKEEMELIKTLQVEVEISELGFVGARENGLAVPQ